METIRMKEDWNEKIVSALATFTDLGMEIKFHTVTSLFNKHELEMIANYYSVVVAQSVESKIYGPFPVPYKDDWVLVTLKFQLIDHSVQDPRVKASGGKVPSFILIFFHESLFHQISLFRDRMESLLSHLIQNWHSVFEISAKDLTVINTSLINMIALDGGVFDGAMIPSSSRDAEATTRVTKINDLLAIIKAFIRYDLILTKQLIVMFFAKENEMTHLKRLFSTQLSTELLVGEITLKNANNIFICSYDLEEVIVMVTNDVDLDMKLGRLDLFLDRRLKTIKTMHHLHPSCLYCSPKFLAELIENDKKMLNFQNWIKTNAGLILIVLDCKDDNLLSYPVLLPLIKQLTEQRIDVLIPISRDADSPFIDICAQVFDRLSRKLINMSFQGDK